MHDAGKKISAQRLSCMMYFVRILFVPDSHSRVKPKIDAACRVYVVIITILQENEQIIEIIIILAKDFGHFGRSVI